MAACCSSAIDLFFSDVDVDVTFGDKTFTVPKGSAITIRNKKPKQPMEMKGALKLIRPRLKVEHDGDKPLQIFMQKSSYTES